MEWIYQPWPWYIGGALIGLTVPALLLMGNKSFGISSSLRHICAACIPAKIPFFDYDWKREAWNLFFVGGILLGGIIASQWMRNDKPLEISPETVAALEQLHIPVDGQLLPEALFSSENLLNLKGVIFFVLGGFLVGFGTRYAGGCTSGHAIMGLSNLQWPSLVATCCFMVGGFFTTHALLPFIMQLF